MKNNLLSLEHIVAGERKAILDTNSTLRGVRENIPTSLSVLFQLLYFTGVQERLETIEDEFHSFCWHNYFRAPYTFRSCYILFERGYYLESAILSRSLLESFIQCRYLFNHKDLIRAVWAGQKIKIGETRKFITFKKMFGEISPGYYEQYYGRMFSGFSHGKVGADVFRIERKEQKDVKIKWIPGFDFSFAGFIMNNFIALLFGYLNYYRIFFRKGYNSAPGEFLRRYNSSIKWLQSNMDQHKKGQPISSEWYHSMDKIIHI